MLVHAAVSSDHCIGGHAVDAGGKLLTRLRCGGAAQSIIRAEAITTEN